MNNSQIHHMYFLWRFTCSISLLQWRHNEENGVSNHRRLDWLLNRLSKKTHQSSASLAFVRGIHRWPVNYPHKGPVTRKMFPFDDVIMMSEVNNHNAQSSLALRPNGSRARSNCHAVLPVCLVQMHQKANTSHVEIKKCYDKLLAI